MRWHHVGMAVVALIVMTGCPTEFGKHGRVSRAVRDDSLELVRKLCSQKDYDEVCGNGRAQTPECRERCGE